MQVKAPKVVLRTERRLGARRISGDQPQTWATPLGPEVGQREGSRSHKFAKCSNVGEWRGG